LAPFDCWLALRGLRTMALRMERSAQNCEALADFLMAHPLVRKELECVGKMLGPRLAGFFIAHSLVRKTLECVGKMLGPWLASFLSLTHW